MSASLTIQHKVQAHDVCLPADDLRLPAAVKGESHTAAIQHPARIAPHYREGAEAISSSRNVNPRRASQLMAVSQIDRSGSRDVPVHAPFHFLNPARCHRQPPGSKSVQTPDGGNLARVTFTNAGHFLFPQLPQQLEADVTDPTESAVVLPAADRAGAATDRPAPAKSRPFLLFKVNYVGHAVLPSDCRVSAHRSALAEFSSARADK